MTQALAADSSPASTGPGVDDLGAVFGAGGALAEHIPGFAARDQQLAMAERVATVLERGGTLVCEAGTGTGKTFAYLVPALRAGRKTLISTGTRNLQDQLFHRDLPLVRAALGAPVSLALLKGRGNYLCRHRLTLALGEVTQLGAERRAQLRQVQVWALRTRAGDIAESGLPEDAAIWPNVTSTVDNCLGQDCPEWADCHLLRARRAAQSAEIVVVNHHLLCADLALKDAGFGEVLPGADCFIVDEAHQLPEIAAEFFGVSLGSRQLLDLARDVGLEASEHAPDVPQLLERGARLIRAVEDLRLALGAAERRGPWHELTDSAASQRMLGMLERRLESLADALGALDGRAPALDACRTRAEDARTRLRRLCDSDGEAIVRWYETRGRGWRLHETPLEVGGLFSEQLARASAAWVFTSATLAVDHDFTHFTARLGIAEAETACWDSPFDYPGQALWFVPRGLPQPNSSGYNRAVQALARELIGYSRGRTFVLFTSHRALREAATALADGLDYPLLVQGQAPRAALLERFRALGNAVLLGSASFWEGVDVRGEALSCVIIDRLPFAAPGDPVLAARIDALRRRGGEPFRDYQLPRAVIALKQGAGRLIRDPRDRGVLVVCDPRLLSRSYGRTFLASMPAMRRTRRVEDVRDFFALESAPLPEVPPREEAVHTQPDELT